MAGLVKVGVTSWTEKSLIASGWYPRGAGTSEGRLRYYASQFPVVENDSMYYALPPPDRAELWVARTPDDFTMNVKAFASLTQHYTDPARLPPELREALPAEVRAKRRAYPRDLGEEILREIAARFRAAIEPLRTSGKLGVVLLPFPVWFTRSAESELYLLATRELLSGCRVAVEFRNAVWMNERHRERTLALLREAGLVYTCVDEPQGFPSSIPPIAAATSDLALVRLHGRSASRWKRPTPSAAERFRYRYKVDELEEWVPRVERLAGEAEVVHVLFNNCYSNYAVTNARQLTEILEASNVEGEAGVAIARPSFEERRAFEPRARGGRRERRPARSLRETTRSSAARARPAT